MSEDLEELLGVGNVKLKKLEELRKEKSKEELKEVVLSYLKSELRGDFQLKPEKAFEFGRKMRNEYSLSLKEVENLVNYAVFDAFKEVSGEIKTMLCHQFYENYLGYFVSGLYHDVIGKRKLQIEINLPEIIVRSRVGFRWGFGYKHSSGELLIKGYAGGYLGEEMRGGKIVVIGFTGDCVGKNMRGGEIYVKGGAGWRVGEGMRGGKILIVGDVGEFTGINMKAGLIRVKGNVISTGKRDGGKVEVWKDGKWITI